MQNPRPRVRGGARPEIMRWEDNSTGNVHQQSLVPVSDPARHRSDTDTDGLPSGHFQVFKATLALHYLLLATLVTGLVCSQDTSVWWHFSPFIWYH